MPKVCKAVIAANPGFFDECKVEIFFPQKIIISNLVNDCHILFILRYFLLNSFKLFSMYVFIEKGHF